MVAGQWNNRLPPLAVYAFFAAAVMAAAALAFAQEKGAAQKARTIEVTAQEFKFEPAEIKVKAGELVEVKLTNKGKAPHNIAFELPGGEVKLKNPIKAGDSGVLSFTAPKKAGKYTVYCPVGNHKDKGMTAQLVVEQ
jgi:plastocyanin